MIIKTLDCRIVTPMFLRGANQALAEIRPSSIKGALRFWWRARKGSLYNKNLDTLRKEEAKLFGSVDEDIGKSSMSLFVDSPLRPSRPRLSGLGRDKDVPVKHYSINILEYLAYGVTGRGVPVCDNCFSPGQTFQLELGTRSQEQMVELLDSLGALMLFGGLGAKSRNGFGKIWIQDLEDRLPIIQKEFFQGSMTPYLSGHAGGVLFRTSNSYRTWHEALAELGKIYRSARLSIEPQHDTRKRSLIASPVNESKSTIAKGIKLQRHSKNIFLGVRPNEDRFEGYVLVAPYKFLQDHGDSKLIPESIRQNLSLHQTDFHGVHGELIRFFSKQRLIKINGQ